MGLPPPPYSQEQGTQFPPSSMFRKPTFASACAFLFASSLLGICREAVCAPPQINGVSPLGIRRAYSTELTFNGANLAGNPRLIAPFGFKVDSPAPKGDASNWKLTLTADASTPVGIYPVRIQTDDGISNPFLVAIGQLPQIAEKEDNSTFETAQKIPDFPLVVEGQVAGNDVDFFRFHGKKGQAILVDAQCARIGSGVDPSIRLTAGGANRSYVASADDSAGLATDARLTAVLPADGDYVVELADSRYQGGGRPVYRLVIGAVPEADEVFPLGGRQGETVGLELRGGMLSGMQIATATVNPLSGTRIMPARIASAALGSGAGPVAGLDLESLPPLVASHYPEIREPADAGAAPPKAVAPVVLNGRIDPAGENDRFVIATTPGGRLRINVEASELGSALDGVLQVLGNNGAVIANADDTNIPQPARAGQQAQVLVIADPSLDLTIPGGTNEITLVIRDLENRGGIGFPYRIVVEPLFPDFELVANESQVSVPRGGTASIGVTIVRKGFSGPITVTVADPPAGLTVRPGTIAAGQAICALTLSASTDASFAAAPLKLVGRAQGTEGPLERLATKGVVYASQNNVPMCSIEQFGLVAAPALALPVTLETPATPIEVPHGYSATIPVKVVRTQGADAAMAITALPLPAGLAVPKMNIAEKAGEGKVTVTAAVAAPLGTSTLVLQAKAKLGGAERVLDMPAVTLNVVPPAALELAANQLEIKPGATVELKGKINRKGSFDAPVTVKINGLPAGLKADPVTVAGKDFNFVIKVVAEAKAPVATADTRIALAFQVEKKDYSMAPTPLAVKVVAGK
jgi:hypothetical protein